MNSFWNVEINNKITDNNSDKLVVLLPGINYSIDRPLIDYSKRLALQMKYDAIAIDYGFQIAKKKFDKDTQLNIIIEESINVLYDALKEINKKYKEIILIGKSIGTVVQIYMQKKLKNEFNDIKITNIYLTPIEKTYELGMKKSLVITGTEDSWISKSTVEKISENRDIKVIIINGANHSLNTDGDILKTVDDMKVIIKAECDYLIGNCG